MDTSTVTQRVDALGQLLGNDGHHGAFNSVALAHAHDLHGNVVGLSGATLRGALSGYRSLVGVDARGEPDGQVNEDARYPINPRSMMYVEYDARTADGNAHTHDSLAHVQFAAPEDVTRIGRDVSGWRSHLPGRAG